MRILPHRLAGPILIEPNIAVDGRGFFVETFRKAAYADVGVAGEFVQDNHSRSSRGTVRALHFQTDPGQAKLVRVARGRVFDVVVDLRRSSPTFGRWEGFELDDEAHRQLYVPIGFAHGFCVLSGVADVVYKVGSYYDPATEQGIAWDDSDLAIDWPIRDVLVSDRDAANPPLRDIQESLPNW